MPFVSPVGSDSLMCRIEVSDSAELPNTGGPKRPPVPPEINPHSLVGPPPTVPPRRPIGIPDLRRPLLGRRALHALRVPLYQHQPLLKTMRPDPDDDPYDPFARWRWRHRSGFRRGRWRGRSRRWPFTLRASVQLFHLDHAQKERMRLARRKIRVDW